MQSGESSISLLLEVILFWGGGVEDSAIRDGVTRELERNWGFRRWTWRGVVCECVNKTAIVILRKYVFPRILNTPLNPSKYAVKQLF